MNTSEVTIKQNTIDVGDDSSSVCKDQRIVESSLSFIPMSTVKENTVSFGAERDTSVDPEAEKNEMDMCHAAGETSQSASVYKDEPTDIEMDLAEDFTKTGAHFTQNAVAEIKREPCQEKILREQAAESQAVLQIANSSLSLLSQYISSESESNITDSEEELPSKASQADKYDSDSDDSDGSVEVVQNPLIYRSQQDSIIVSDVETVPSEKGNQSDEDLFSSGEESLPPVPVKGKGEMLVHELPPIEELQITVPETQCKAIGHIQSIVAQIVIVQSLTGVELLDIDTVLFLEKGKRSLGKIFDVIGQVAAPMYCVLFNSRQEVIDKGIAVGAPVYCAPQTEHTQFIILSELMKYRGSDASWLDDTEAPEYALDYSDDEQERRARTRRNSRSSSAGRQTPDGGERHNRLFHRSGRTRGNNRGRQSGHSWHHNIARSNHPQRVINPFAYALSSAGILPPPPPPPPPPPSN